MTDPAAAQHAFYANQRPGDVRKQWTGQGVNPDFWLISRSPIRTPDPAPATAPGPPAAKVSEKLTGRCKCQWISVLRYLHSLERIVPNDDGKVLVLVPMVPTLYQMQTAYCVRALVRRAALGPLHSNPLIEDRLLRGEIWKLWCEGRDQEQEKDDEEFTFVVV